MHGNWKMRRNGWSRPCGGLTIGEEQLDLPTEQFETDGREKELSFEGKTIDEVVNDIERRMIDDALKISLNKQKAAQTLGLSRQG